MAAAWLSSVFVLTAWCSLLTAAAQVTRSIPNTYGANPFTSFSDGSGQHTVFPSNLGPTGGGLYFSNNMDFNSFPGRILVGAADALYILDMNLDPVEGGVLQWNASEMSVTTCKQNKRYSSRADYYCRNHIRVYSRYAADPNLLFVCGTQSISTAQCRAVNVSSGNFVRAYEAFNVNHTILSTDPDYASYGRFRNLRNDATSFITWYYYQTDSVSYTYAYEVQEVQWNAESGRFTNTLKYGSLDSLISGPAYIADFTDLNYQLTSTMPSRNFDYYYAFVRERTSYTLDLNTDSEESSISHAVRVCQNDPGANYSDGMTPNSFGTALKARLYCNFEGPNTDNNPLAASEFRYDNIWSVTFSGSDVDDTLDTQRTVMYAAFSGSLTGPPGSAICVFNAHATPLANTGTNSGLFDTFKEDISIDLDPGFTTTQHSFFDCTGQSRPTEGSASSVTTRTSVVSVAMQQITLNPWFVFDGFYITGMTTDVVCVVMQSDRSRCRPLDVLFAGTSHGRVMKMWGEGGGENKLPSVIAEEINLEQDVYITSLSIRAVNEEKFLFASTSPQLYRLSLERCGRHGNLSECVGSRDPYCVWNAINDTCEFSTLNSTMPVPPHIIQNVFDGRIPDIVNVTLTSSQYNGTEGETLDVMVVASGNLSEGLLSVSLYRDDLRIKGPQNITEFVSGTKSVSIALPDDQVFMGTQELRLCLETADFIAVQFSRRCADVTVADNDVFSVSLEQSDYSAVEGTTITVNVLTDSAVPDGQVSLSLYGAGGNVVDGPHVLRGLSAPQLSVSVTLPDDQVFVGRQKYSLRLSASTGAVAFSTEVATVTLLDNDGFFGQVGLDRLDEPCLKWKTIAIDSKLNSLDTAIKAGIKEPVELSRIGVFCHNTSTANLLYVAVYRFNITTSSGNARVLADALRQWVSGGMTEESKFKSFEVATSCVSEISSTDQELCSFLSIGALTSPGSRESAVIGLAVAVVVLFATTMVFLSTTVGTCFWYKKLRPLKEVAMENGPGSVSNGHKPSSNKSSTLTRLMSNETISPQHQEKSELSTVPAANGVPQVPESCNSNYSSQFSTQFSKTSENTLL